MKREAWMSDAGYKSGVLAERKLRVMLRKQAEEDSRRDAVAGEWWTSAMATWVGVSLLLCVLYGVGMASAHVGMLDLMGIDSKLAVQESAVGWRVWFGGSIVFSMLCVVVIVAATAVYRRNGRKRTDAAV